MPWIKLYTELLDDPKLGEMPDQLKLRFIQLLLVAGECDADGCLINGDNAMTIGQLAWRLRINADQLTADIEAIRKTGLLSDCDGALCITNFAKRQGRSQNERRERWRKAQQAKRAKGKKSDDTTPTPSDDQIPTPENVIDDSSMSQRPREEKRREDIAANAASASTEIEIDPTTTSVADATQPTPQNNISTTGEHIVDFLDMAFDRLEKQAGNPDSKSEDTIRRWNLPPHLEAICIQFVKLAHVPVMKGDKGKWAKGALDLHELGASAVMPQAMAAGKKDHLRLTWPGALVELCRGEMADAQPAQAERKVIINGVECYLA